MRRSVYEAGYSVLELFVVVAIVSCMLSLLFWKGTGTSSQARDTKRIEHVHVLAKALEMYSIANKQYPATGGTIQLTGKDMVSAALVGAGDIAQIPIDPLTPTYEYRYTSNTNGSMYAIEFCMETDLVTGFALGCGNVYTP